MEQTYGCTLFASVRQEGTSKIYERTEAPGRFALTVVKATLPTSDVNH
jgi:hypothetical protein